jgi:hypothetical protein
MPQTKINPTLLTRSSNPKVITRSIGSNEIEFSIEGCKLYFPYLLDCKKYFVWQRMQSELMMRGFTSQNGVRRGIRN